MSGPIVTAGSGGIFLGGGPAVAVDPDVTVSDASADNLTGATVSIGAGLLAGDTLGVADQNGITGSYDAASGVLTLSGAASVADYQAALASVTYGFAPAGGDPTKKNTDTSRSIAFSVTNGATTSGPASTTLAVLHAAPSVTVTPAETMNAGDPAIGLNPNLTISAPDSNGMIHSATVTFSGLKNTSPGPTSDSIGIDSNPGNSAPSGVSLTLSGADEHGAVSFKVEGVATVAVYEAVLRTINLGLAKIGTEDRVVTYSVNDGVDDSPGTTTTVSPVGADPAGPDVDDGFPTSLPTDPPPSGTIGLGQGSITVTTEPAGGLSPPPAVYAAAAPANPPSVTITTQGRTTNQAGQVISGVVDVADAGSTVSLYDIDNNGSTVVGTGQVNQDGAWSIPVTLVQGTNVLSASDTNGAGNGTSNAVVFNLDTVPPTVTITGVEGSENEAYREITGTALKSNGAVETRGTGVAVYDNGALLGTTLVGYDGSWFVLDDLTTEGGNALTAVETDAAGNTGVSPTVTATLDTIAPLVGISTAGGPTTDAVQVISGTGEAGTVVTVFDNNATAASADVAADGTWSAQLGLPVYGNNDVYALDTDSAGNIADSNFVRFVLSPLDSTPPVVTVDPSAAILAPTVVSISGMATDVSGVSTVQVYNAGALLGSAPVDPFGHWTYTADVGAGSFGALAAFASDPSGNLGGAFAPFQLVTGIADRPYAAQEIDLDAARNPTTVSNYRADGSLVSQSLDTGDGTHSAQAFANRQVLETRGNDTLTGNGVDERFVFDPGFGHAEVTDFVLGGAAHDRLDLSATGPFTLAQVIRRTTMSGAGAVIHVAPGDTITLDGVSKAQLKAHPKDFAFG